MIRFILGRAGSGKTHRVMASVARDVALRRAGSVIIVPEQYSHATERELISIAGNTASLYSEVVSFKRLAAGIAEICGGAAEKPVDEGGRALILYSAISALGGELSALSCIYSRPEFIARVLKTMDELRLSGVTPEKLYEAADFAPAASGGKLRDISKIYAAYIGAFARDELDPTTELDRLAESLKTCDFFCGKGVYIDSFSGFTPQEFKVIEQIVKIAEQVTVTLCVDRNALSETENGIFSKALETLNRLKRMGEFEIEFQDDNRRAKNECLRALERGIFSTGVTCESCEGISLISAADEFSECEVVAGEIVKLVRSGVRYRDICVATRELSAYAGHLEIVFRRYGIPLYLNRKSDITDKPIIALLCGALGVINDNFRYEAVAKYLKTGFAGISRRHLDIFENYLYTWNIRGSQWTREQGFTQGDNLELINRIRDKVRQPIIELKRALRGEFNGETAAQALYDYINKINLSRRLEARTRLLRRRGELQAAEEYRLLWRLVCDAIDSIGRTLKNTRMGIEELARIISTVMEQYQIGVIPISLDRVSACDISRVGDSRVSHMFLIGALDGLMPQLSEPQGLLSDLDREFLNEYGIELPAGGICRLSEEFRLIYKAVSTPERALAISYPRKNLSGEERRPSVIIQRILNIFPSLCVEPREVLQARMQAILPCFDAMCANEFFEKNLPEYASRLKTAREKAQIKRGPIKLADNIRNTFGEDIFLSSTRADSFVSCSYAYFMRYGLSASPRRQIDFDALAIGTYVHAIFESTLKEANARGGIENLGAGAISEIASEKIRDYIQTELNGFADCTPRFRCLFFRIRRIIESSLAKMCAELGKSDYKPVDFELKFSDSDGELPAIRRSGEGFTVALGGKVDRIDACDTPEGMYVRVVDYKTGAKSLSLDKIINGLDMQMLLYLFALEENGAKRYGKKVIPAAAEYFIAANVGENGANTRSGITLTDAAMPQSLVGKAIDRELLGKVKERVYSELVGIGQRLSSGQIDAQPLEGADDPCKYCDFKSACLFDEKCGDVRRRLVNVTSKDLIAELEAEHGEN